MSVKTVKVYACDDPGCTATVQGTLPDDWADSRGRSGLGHRCPKHITIPCPGCGRGTRPQHRVVPGTVRRSANGYCVNCVRGGSPVDTVPPQQVRYLKRLIVDRFDDPNDRLLIMDQLGIGADL